MSINVPTHVTMSGKAIKMWGVTQTIFLSDLPSHHAIAHLNKGGFSSRHSHEHLWNRFHVVNGQLKIDIWKNNAVETIIIGKGETLDIPPKVEHRMSAITDVDVLEIYWSDDDTFDAQDIKRVDNGGIKEDESVFMAKIIERDNLRSIFEKPRHHSTCDI